MNVLNFKLLLVMGAALSVPFAQASTEIIVNGGFETGNFTGWEVNEKGGSALFVESGFVSPATAYPTIGPNTGGFYALADGPFGATSLVQRFSLGAVSSASLGFDMFVNSGAVSAVHATGLDQTSGGSYEPNQHVRVDILSGTANAFDTGSGVLGTYYLGINSPKGDLNYSHNQIDVTGLLAAGGSYQLRFAQVNNQDYLLQGIDNVSLTITPVPEPKTYALMVAGLGLIGFAVRRR